MWYEFGSDQTQDGEIMIQMNHCSQKLLHSVKLRPGKTPYVLTQNLYPQTVVKIYTPLRSTR